MTPSPASPSNVPASLGSPGHRGQPGGPRAAAVCPQVHMESPNTVTARKAEPFKREQINTRVSGWALSDPARLHHHKRGRLATRTHMEEFHREGWLSTGLWRRDASGGTNPTLLTPGSRMPSLSSHENTYSCYSRLVPLPRPTALVCLLQQPELIPQPCGCTNAEVTWEPAQHSLEPPQDQPSITETMVPEGGKDGHSPWDTRACCPRVAAWGRSGEVGVAPGSDGAVGQAGALDHSRPRPAGPRQGTDA